MAIDFSMIYKSLGKIEQIFCVNIYNKISIVKKLQIIVNYQLYTKHNELGLNLDKLKER